MRLLLALAFAFIAFSPAAQSEEEGGEHEAKKPPPKPSHDTPGAQIMKLPVVQQWAKWESDHKRGRVMTWGEEFDFVNGQDCWGIILGETSERVLHVWRHFCVPKNGGDILVGSVPAHPDEEITYMPYDKWVTYCKPTASDQGSC